MQSALKRTARVLPGRRIEVTVPEFDEGEDVELIVLKAEPPAPASADTAPGVEEPMGVWDWLQSLPPSKLTTEDWERIEREMQEEKDAWDC